MLERSFGQRGDEGAEALGQAARHRVREPRRAFQVRLAHELDRVVGDCVRRRLAPRDLVGGDAQCSQDGGIELSCRAAPERVDAVVDRAHALHGSVGDALREGAVARVELARGRGKCAVGVGVVLEHAPHDVERDAAGRRDHRTPRRNSA